MFSESEQGHPAQPRPVHEGDAHSLPQAEKITEDLEIAPLPGATSTTGDSTGEGTNTAGNRARPMTTAERARLRREFAVEYSNSEATSALDPTNFKALILGRGDDTRYDKRMHAPVPGAKVHYCNTAR